MIGRGGVLWVIGGLVLGCGESARDSVSNAVTPGDGITASNSPSDSSASDATPSVSTTQTEPAPSTVVSVSPEPSATPPAPVVVDCDAPSPGFGACWAYDICREGADYFHASVVASVCIPELGFEPADDCTAFQLLGRCFEPNVGTWEHHYFDRSGPSATELQQGCEALAGRIWCTGPLGVPDATSRECRRACDAARPDYSLAPECLDADTCFSDCLDAVAAEGGCAECVTARISWASGGCNEFECSCPPATFD